MLNKAFVQFFYLLRKCFRYSFSTIFRIAANNMPSNSFGVLRLPILKLSSFVCMHDSFSSQNQVVLLITPSILSFAFCAESFLICGDRSTRNFCKTLKRALQKSISERPGIKSGCADEAILFPYYAYNFNLVGALPSMIEEGNKLSLLNLATPSFTCFK